MKFKKNLLALILVTFVLFNNTFVVFGFSDVTKDSPDENAISRVCGLGIMKGNDDGTFAPSNNLTRAEMASVLFNIVNYGNTDDYSDSEWKNNFFGDVSEEVKENHCPNPRNINSVMLLRHIGHLM